VELLEADGQGGEEGEAREAAAAPPDAGRLETARKGLEDLFNLF